MRLLARFAHLIWGDEVDRALRPILATSLAGSLAFSTGWSFMGIWAIDELGAKGSTLGIAWLVGAILAAVSGFVGGHVSDHVGRRPVMLIGWGGMACYMLLFLLPGDDVLFGLSIMACAGIFGALGGSVGQAMVADLVPPEKHETAYASVRIASNLGVTVGPPLGALLLTLGGWNLLFVGVSLLASLGFLLAYRYLPKHGRYAPDTPPQRGSFGVIARDRVFLIFLAGASLAWIVYVAYETVLPITLVDSYGFQARTWGLLVVLNPLLVTLFQLRLTRRAEGVSPGLKWVVAMMLMGLPFLLLEVSHAALVVALVIVIFVIGEMLWVPTSQAVVAGLAPADLRGAYMGAFGSGGAFGFALAPFFGLQIREAYGDGAMWGFFATIALVSAGLGSAAIASAARHRRVEPEESPAAA